MTPGATLRRRARETPLAVPYAGLPGVPFAATAGCSYAELDRLSRAVAARLGGELPPGSRVLLVYRHGPDLAGALYGCLYAGMVAVPCPLRGGADGAGRPVGGRWRSAELDVVGPAVERVTPAAVLTSSDGWAALPVDLERVPVLEADGARVDGRQAGRLAARWRPVGVLPGADAYRRYMPGLPGDPAGGRLEPALSHADLLHVLRELRDARRLGARDDELSWIAAVQGMDDVIWRLLLPVHEGHAVWEAGGPLGPGRE